MTFLVLNKPVNTEPSYEFKKICALDLSHFSLLNLSPIYQGSALSITNAKLSVLTNDE